MPAPVSTAPELANYLAQIETRLAKLETPGAPIPLFAIASTALTVANAATYINCQVYAPDLNMTAFSSGAHWFRSDTGALII